MGHLAGNLAGGGAGNLGNPAGSLGNAAGAVGNLAGSVTGGLEAVLQTVQHELESTLRILKAFPADKANFRPNDRLRSVGDVARSLMPGQGGPMDQFTGNQIPNNLTDIVNSIERTTRDVVEKLPKVQDLQGKIQPLLQALLSLAQVRTQLSIYLGLAGEKMPEGMGI